MYNQIIVHFYAPRGNMSLEINANSRLIVSVSQGVHGNCIKKINVTSLLVFLFKKKTPDCRRQN